MGKKILTREEQAIDWLKSEMEKDKIELDKEKKQLIESLKDFKKEDLVVQKKELTIWQKIKKVLLT